MQKVDIRGSVVSPAASKAKHVSSSHQPRARQGFNASRSLAAVIAAAASALGTDTIPIGAALSPPTFRLPAAAVVGIRGTAPLVCAGFVACHLRLLGGGIWAAERKALVTVDVGEF